mmetsp:Transcript_101564/g.310587  ORF Transcript_101564/g.310587 Transcript_101564/m.310587 type:complete len:217 (+) Transcript_101564:1171-1821(+)
MGTSLPTSCSPATAAPTAVITLAKIRWTAGESYGSAFSPLTTSTDQSRYLLRTSGVKCCAARGAASKKRKQSRRPTTSVPMTCTLVQLCSTVPRIWPVGSMYFVRDVAPPSIAAPASSCALWPRNSRKRFRSLTMWPRGMPMSIMSASSMSSKVSMSSKPLLMSGSAYCGKPASVRKATTGWSSTTAPSVSTASAGASGSTATAAGAGLMGTVQKS